MTRNQRFRKAAILVASLDAQSADALLDEMPPEDAARVRHAVMELGEIDPQEQQRIIRDFVGQQSRGTVAHGPGVELAPSLAARLGTEPASGTSAPPHPPSDSTGMPFRFLEHVEAADLVEVLLREHPQTTAIVISHLPPARAADVLRRLPRSLQSEALIRIARLKALAADVVRDIEHEMQSLLQNRRQLEPVAPQGLAAIQAILLATASPERQALLDELVRQDQALASRLNDTLMPHAATASGGSMPAAHEPPWPAGGRRGGAEQRGCAARSCTVAFADLEALEDAALAHVLRRSSPSTALLALAGASHDFVARIMRQLPTREAGLLQRRMRELGPIRLDDIERAQLRLAEVAQQLIDQGSIALPSLGRFAAAA